MDKRPQYSIGLPSPVLCCHRYARSDTFGLTGTLLSPVKKLRVTSPGLALFFSIFRIIIGFSAIKVSNKRPNLKFSCNNLVVLQGRPPIIAHVVRRTIYCVGKLRTIYFKNCVVVDVYSRVHSRISKFCIVAGLSAFFFFDLTDFDLLIGILHIVPVQPKFEILVFFCDRVTVRIAGHRTSDLPPRGPAHNHVIRRESSVDLSNQIEEKPKTAESNSDHLGGGAKNGGPTL